MEGNGTRDIGSFAWVHTKILEGLEASGMNPDHVEALRQKVAGMTQALQEFRAKCQALEASRKYSAQGLADAAVEEAAKAAGVIRRVGDNRYLLDNIRQTEAQLTPAKPDPAESLLGFWRQMEIRSTLAAQGTGPEDPLKAEFAYRAALERGDHDTLLALEGWPLGSPVSPGLISQGQQQRDAHRNPIAAAKLHDLQALQEAMAQAVHDALAELPLSTDDPMARQAGAEAGTEPHEPRDQ
jgi:hypothetical protein